MRRYVQEGQAEALVASYASLRAFAAVVAPLDVEPDDLMQDGFERFLRHRDRGDIDNVEAYFRRILVNVANDHRRRMARRRGAIRLVGLDTEEKEQQYPSDLVALFEIEPLARGLMYLVEVEGWDISSAATALGCTPSAARQRLSRARRRLRVALTEAD